MKMLEKVQSFPSYTETTKEYPKGHQAMLASWCHFRFVRALDINNAVKKNIQTNTTANKQNRSRM
jgi:hypothetical protein